MNQELTEETLEEGRVALYQLERQLKERNAFPSDNQSESTSSKQPSYDRRVMDQLPRLARLSQRSESLGLTVEELDDRGLLEGGGSVPHYYTSAKQRNRRFLELQPRSNRLQERGKEALSKLLNGLFHMVRVLSKRGLDLESTYRAKDTERKGLVHRKQFLSSLKNLGMPFSSKELHDIVQQYVQHGTDYVDYVAFLKDARVYRKIQPQSEMDYSRQEDAFSFGDFSSVLSSVKRMLLDAARSLNKQPDDIYRMFARWDTQGTGTVTATQFLRVLARLHVELSDQDQDFLVELLDTNAMGRIDFDGLLVYCFGAYEPDTQSPQGIPLGTHQIVMDDNAGETLSAVSTEGNNSLELKSTSSLGILRRPRTASLSRPYNDAPSAFMVDQPAVAVSDSSWNVGEGKGFPRSFTRARPLTASGRVAPHSFMQDRSSIPRQGPGVDGDELLLIDLPDDVINGEENYLGSGSQQPTHMPGDGKDADLLYEDVGHHPTATSQSYLQDYLPPLQDLSVKADPEEDGSDPIDHLVLLATQILSTLRDIILARYRRGRSLREIFHHFDRDNKQYFDAQDFVQATADLRIETSERVANIAIRQMAIDSADKVSFGEFKVFLLDADNKLLELNVQEQLASILEQQGREFRTWMYDVFWAEDDTLNDSRVSVKSGKDRHHEFVSKSGFVSAIKKIGLVLTSAEISRLVDRFDVHGSDQCSVTRFVLMVQGSGAWKHAESVLRFQDQALEEGRFLRAQNASGQTNASPLPQLSEELISMCEYLGICVVSEQNMIWIAADALKAPLPVNWVAQKDGSGRLFFHNRLTGQSRWEHPLDPHFRKLRDKYRQSSNENDALSPARGFRMSSMQPQVQSQSALNAWQPALVGQRPNIEVYAPQLHESSKPQSDEFDLSRPRPQSATVVTNTRRMNRDGHDAGRPISASHAPIPKPAPPSSAVLNATRAVTEAIYSAGYLKAVPQAAGSRGLSQSAQSTPFAAYALGHHSNPAGAIAITSQAPKPRVTSASSSGRKSGQRSAVDRALSVGRSSQFLVRADRDGGHDAKQGRNQKLAEMFDGNILDKLDMAIGAKR